MRETRGDREGGNCTKPEGGNRRKGRFVTSGSGERNSKRRQPGSKQFCIQEVNLVKTRTTTVSLLLQRVYIALGGKMTDDHQLEEREGKKRKESKKDSRRSTWERNVTDSSMGGRTGKEYGGEGP